MRSEEEEEVEEEEEEEEEEEYPWVRMIEKIASQWNKFEKINLRENVPGLVGGLIREWGLSFWRSLH